MAEKWQVTGQRQTTVLANGSFEQAMVVTFKTEKGVIGSVTVPMSQYTQDNVSSLIEQQAELLDGVQGLTASQAQGSQASSA